ncbi:hypothetical protein [Dictyobacter kobayashii]|uniref:Single-stranded DNA-binding protein n=1 Tax=Dictyobacter kobayashii TaxID=2014872 RepID=A0A402ADU6_9CHLR|nr:hypothetical protein [Dictyobacter kobayashii]GCE17287.1 hypothetical protein KDK_10870 [Dictyobacter kobayashii]
MAMTFTGFVKAGGVYEVGKDKKPMISFTAVDELGNTYACQMWQDDPQFQQLAQAIPQSRRQQISFEVAAYTSRMRTFKDGSEKPQTNFIVTRVSVPALGLQAA